MEIFIKKEVFKILFPKYEFHFMTKLCFSDLMKKLEAAGYKIKLEPVKGGEGIKTYIMNGNMGIDAIISLYETDDGYYTYEAKVKTRDDFMKLHDIMSAI